MKRWLSNAQRIVIVGVGNPIRQDDNIGAEIVDGLEGRVLKTIILLKSETIPEECIGQIADLKPTHVLVIDAALLSLQPGSARLNESMELSGTVISTHTFPIQIFCQTLVEMTGTKIAMLLIQPKDTGFGEGLTPELDLAKRKLIDLLAKITESVLK
ncbi:hydrogenase maturation protease [Candidatus Bathyarchaeota archaeon]|nr:hydrogenase maturation protease [Candidatus Bathyarchaeota archaeon]